MSKDNGGPAFPFGQTDIDSGQLVNGWGSEGMSLRDYFAANAMAAMIPAFLDDKLHEGANIEHAAYVIADAMLAERAK